MALLTTTQKQRLIVPVLLFFVVGGFLGAVWQGNPVAITILVLVVSLISLVIFFKIRKSRQIAAAKNERVRRAQRRYSEHLAEVERRARSLAPLKAEPVTINFQIPVMSNDTVESLTVRVMEQYAERGGTIPVAEAKAMACQALAKQGEPT